nr:hypothetical protein [uncultured Cohaesibacter sp.]
MLLLTELQIRCILILQRRTALHSASKTGTIAWELNKTRKQATDCLVRLCRKGLVSHAGWGLWSLTEAGQKFQTELPPGE